MSYCVNCGVKLSPPEKVCPLCGTPVINPNENTESVAVSAYPDRVEKYRPLNVKFIVKLFWLGVAAVCAIVVLCDLLSNGRIAWSSYVAAGAVYAGGVLTVISARSKAGAFCVMTAGTLLLLLTVAMQTGGLGWFFRLASPLTLLYSAFVTFSAAIRKAKSNGFFKVSLCLLLFAFVLIGTECFIDAFVSGEISLLWSLYSAIPFAVIGLMLFAVSRSRKLTEEIKKRSFL